MILSVAATKSSNASGDHVHVHFVMLNLKVNYSGFAFMHRAEMMCLLQLLFSLLNSFHDCKKVSLKTLFNH